VGRNNRGKKEREGRRDLSQLKFLFTLLPTTSTRLNSAAELSQCRRCELVITCGTQYEPVVVVVFVLSYSSLAFDLGRVLICRVGEVCCCGVVLVDRLPLLTTLGPPPAGTLVIVLPTSPPVGLMVSLNLTPPLEIGTKWSSVGEGSCLSPSLLLLLLRIRFRVFLVSATSS